MTNMTTLITVNKGDLISNYSVPLFEKEGLGEIC